MPTDDDQCPCPEVGGLMEMTHETMMARWRHGLVTLMSSTISTFAKTDGSWWTAGQATWLRVPLAGRNELLDLHHDRFESYGQAKFPAATVRANPWDKRPPQSSLGPPPTQVRP